ncbi:helix-turn-helix transcriptional regulator [Heyndrickxia faecalis]|uniref:helix-turn-helix transcriptional regulator n=1 Tax=Heyndrickxia TaxID=2837504 RepID=UPI001459D03B|nr:MULTISPECIES: helix-turn-helix transcriptional regulator [Heyndrickxia]MED4866145.1 helix-turn-helix transcriptional regulator [Weizmannia sp. CD-2023]NMH83300.1 helix-turn-helix transcriptional regulator [Heyndrickxia coagulans]
MKKKLLVQRRELLGYSQQDVADLVGIDRSYYTKIENGLTPSVKVAKALGYHLGFDWTIFFDDNCAKVAQKSREVS